MILNQVLRTSPLRTTSLLFRRPLSTTPSKFSNPLLFKNSQFKTALAHPKFFQKSIVIRTVASAVSGRPGSQTLGHAATNIREEVGNSTADLAKVIAGGNTYSDSVEPTERTFLGITNAVAHAVPKPYIVYGLAGGLPYLGASAATVYLANQAGLAVAGLVPNMDPGVAITLLDQALNFQMTYGAVMLSFLGALHWGFEFSGFGGHHGYSRLTLGALPVVWGWSTLAFQPMPALILQWVGFTGMWYCDLKTTNAGWSPKWYSQYRFYLSILVGSCIIATLAATSYWGPVGGHGLVSHDLEMIRAERQRRHPSNQGLVAGEIEALAGDKAADHYVIVKHKEHEEH